MSQRTVDETTTRQPLSARLISCFLPCGVKVPFVRRSVEDRAIHELMAALPAISGLVVATDGKTETPPSVPATLDDDLARRFRMLLENNLADITEDGYTNNSGSDTEGETVSVDLAALAPTYDAPDAHAVAKSVEASGLLTVAGDVVRRQHDEPIGTVVMRNNDMSDVYAVRLDVTPSSSTSFASVVAWWSGRQRLYLLGQSHDPSKLGPVIGGVDFVRGSFIPVRPLGMVQTTETGDVKHPCDLEVRAAMRLALTHRNRYT